MKYTTLIIALTILLASCATRHSIAVYDSSKLFSSQEIASVQAKRDSLKKVFDIQKAEFEKYNKIYETASDSTLKASAQSARVGIFQQLQQITNQFDAASKPLTDKLNKALESLGSSYDLIQDKASLPVGSYVNPANDITEQIKNQMK